MSAADALFNDFQVLQARKEIAEQAARADRNFEACQSWKNAAKVALEGNASNLAMRYALARQLEKVDPNNPLLKDQILREKLLDAGARAYAINENFDDSREVGKSFKIPGRD